MKKLLFYIFTATALGSLASSIANDKIYVNSKDVMIAENGIFIHHDGAILLVDNIAFDGQGIYVSSSGMIDIPQHQTWICPNKNCLHANVPWNKTCSNCGRKAPNNKENK